MTLNIPVIKMCRTDKHIFHEAYEKILHASLPIDSETILMGSDLTQIYKQPISVSNFALYLNTDNKEEADRRFHELSEGGKIEMTMNRIFWGFYYDMLTDKFGIDWKITFNLDTE